MSPSPALPELITRIAAFRTCERPGVWHVLHKSLAIGKDFAHLEQNLKGLRALKSSLAGQRVDVTVEL